MAEHVQVETELTVKDAASAELARIKGGFHQLSEEQRRASTGLGFFKTALATAVGVNLMPLVHDVYEFGRGMFEAAEADEKVTRTFAALKVAMDGLPWTEAVEEGEKMNDMLDDLSIKTGQSNDALNQAYQRLVEISGSTDKATASMEPLTRLSAILGKDVGAVAQEFAMMGEGMLRTRGNLFHLLKSTGIFGDNVRKARSEWGKLSEEERGEKLAYGLQKMSAGLKDVPMDFEHLRGSLEQLWGVVKETVGKGLVEKLTEPMARIQKLFVTNRESILKYAAAVGRQVGEWVEKATKHIEEGFKYIETHADEIRTAIEEGFSKAREVIEFILSHKEELMLIFGGLAAKKIGGGVMGAIGAAGQGGAGQLIGGAFKAGQAGTGALGLAGMAGGVAGVVALTGAIVALGAVAYNTSKLYHETAGFQSDADLSLAAVKERFEEMARDPAMSKWSQQELASYERMKTNLLELAKAQGEDTRAAGALADQAFAAHDAMVKMTRPVEDAAVAMGILEKAMDAGQMDVGTGMEDQARIVDQVDDAVQKAINTGNSGLLKYIGSVFTGSTALQSAFGQSGVLTAEGYVALANSLGEGAAEFKAQLMKTAAEMGYKGAGAAPLVKPEALKVSVGGGNTINIKQDFRDQDPDRVAVVFQRDLQRAAENRVMSRGAQRFGGG